ncbi:MAG: hypothetical protein ACTH8I_09725 [Corynebacterium casei]|uniref:hypothetical protein n=2 Tax=Corynebacterium casei TaxID=160386 RepID=UPI003F917CB5
MPWFTCTNFAAKLVLQALPNRRRAVIEKQPDFQLDGITLTGMNTHIGTPAKILFAGIIAAGLSVPAIAGAAESTPNDPAATKALYGQIYDQLKDGEVNHGDSFKLGEREATLCMMGNGYGVHGLAVGPNTSCEFAGEVFAGLIQGSTPEDNARDVTPTTVDAHSPVTGQDYDMDCVTGQDNLITCSGGVGAAVYMF